MRAAGESGGEDVAAVARGNRSAALEESACLMPHFNQVFIEYLLPHAKTI